MMQWLDTGLPLPMGGILNKRSYIAVDNCVSFIIKCIDHPAAANQTFLLSDDNDLSTTDLVRQMGQALGSRPKLFYCPAFFLKNISKLINKSYITDLLLGSFQADISKSKELLNWQPVINVNDGLKKTAAFYLATK